MTLHLPQVPGTIAVVGVLGSTAYGLAHAGSDLDRIGVYVADTRAVLGLRGGTATSNTVVTHEPDFALHELGKYCTLALAANPTVLELMYCTSYDVLDDIGSELVALRSAFLSTKAVKDAYGGYATAQARRLLGRTKEGKEGFGADLKPRTAKHGRHCRRLLMMGEQLLTTGELVLDVGGHRDELFAAGQLAVDDPEAFAAMFEDLMVHFDALTSVLPDQPDFDRVEQFLVDARLRRI